MKIRKVGILTSAVSLIAIGAVILLNMTGIVSYNVLRYLWPILMILFGLEILWTHFIRKAEKIQYSGWSIVLLVLVMVFSFGMFAVKSVIHGIQFGPGYTETVQGQKKIGGQIRNVDIELPNTPVNIVGTSAPVLSYNGVVRIGAASRKEADKAVQNEWTVRTEGNTLILSLANETAGWNFNVGNWGTPSPHLNVEVPQALLTHVVASNGSVHVTAMHAATQVHTSNGSVSLENIQGDATAGTTNGSIVLQNIAGQVNAGTTNGSISGSSLVGGDWSCTTTNGAIKLDFGSQSNAKITASTTNGRVGGNLAWKMDGKEHGTGILGSGANTNTVILRTTNGSVAVNGN